MTARTQILRIGLWRAQYSVNGERRSFALLRPIVDVSAQEGIRAMILDAYAHYEESVAATE